MDKMKEFSNDFRKLLLKKQKSKNIDLSEERIRQTRLVFEEVGGKLRYHIDKDIVDKLSKEDINEIEALWNSYFS